MQQDVGVGDLAGERRVVELVHRHGVDAGKQRVAGQSRLEAGAGAVLQHRLHRSRSATEGAKAEAPANTASGPMASSIRSSSFHFAIRSERAKLPTLICPA